ncbi:hypothetical protein Tco_0655179 [Tanacetum coccineum]|uniref:Uncharacterized protein n=1 Tax=Tanacetum coccineum TaxID=301880 RepID=A0ABQ4X5Y2_9ASTR
MAGIVKLCVHILLEPRCLSRKFVLANNEKDLSFMTRDLVEDPKSEEWEIVVVGSSEIAGRVKNRKESGSQAAKVSSKRKNVILLTYNIH